MTMFMTFGANHLDIHGNSLRNSYVIVEDIDEAFQLRGGKFCTVYPIDKLEKMKHDYNIKEVMKEQVDLRTAEEELVEEN